MSEPPNVMLALPWAAVAGVVVRSPVEGLDRQVLDLAVHRQHQVHALDVFGGLDGLLDQGGRVRQCTARIASRTMSSR